MSQLYVYDNKKIEMAIDKIKASVVDINSEAETCRKALLEKINIETDENKIQLLENMINELFGNAQYNYSILEEFNKNVDSIDRIIKKVNGNLDKVTIKEQEEIINQQAMLIEEQKELINQLRNGEYVENNENVNEEEVEYTEEEQVEKTEEDVQTEENVIDDLAKEEVNVEEPEVASVEVEENVEITDSVNEEVSEEENNFVVEDSTVIPVEEPSIVENVEEAPFIVDVPLYVSEEDSTKTIQSEVQPEINSEVVENNEEVVNEEVASDKEMSDLEKEFSAIDEVVEDNLEKLRFICNGSRPIMIGKTQAEKLDASKSTQEVLVKERTTIGSYVPVSEEISDMPTMIEESAASIEETEEDIEQVISAKMEEAKQLYSEGKTDEANLIMEEISNLNSQNKQLVK